MPRIWLQRLLAVALSASFAVSGLTPAAAAPCPTHDMAMVAGGDAAPGHHGTHADQPASPAPDSHTCTCLGQCSGPSVVAVPAFVSTASVPVTFGPAPRRPEPEYRAALVDFVLPFATAPPKALPA